MEEEPRMERPPGTTQHKERKQGPTAAPHANNTGKGGGGEPPSSPHQRRESSATCEQYKEPRGAAPPLPPRESRKRS